jgi:hypothetical protein
MTLGSICPGCLETSVRYVLNQDSSVTASGLQTKSGAKQTKV